ncbi:hypothetical protein SARC_16199 [Sphaeroforma arctica JP610]|uniref:DEAD-box helicase OB fold domain-containing protein n=1 Tax=Sphaeroforma arctica JP610 TaxID=667725 RepID=A0A0L0F3F4_9EUKA|nr:hypothetical protein SARC_16199 [Sphaeroforma arctica JP610]KNC71265.1 hypothetical protein SARC_16199 [Sphaeroforma arctica JP610]|eukprot:XP_014145167.1 hypothetical protein SARC_16199 [Sphaeroforma arctica JP610]
MPYMRLSTHILLTRRISHTDIKRMRFAYTCEAAMSVGLGGVNGTDAPQLKSGHSIDGHDTMMNASGIVYVHPESCLSSSLPDLVVFTELMAGSSKHSKLFMKGVTSVKPEWLPVMVPHMCSFSKPLEQPAPRYDAKTDQVKCHMSSAFGKVRGVLISMYLYACYI